MNFHRLVGCALLVAALGLVAGPAGAEEVWVVRSGQTTLHFNADLLRDLGLEIQEVEATSQPQTDLVMEAPNWTFAIEEGTDLKFRVEHGNPLPNGLVSGAIRHGGSSMRIVERTSGRQLTLTDLEIAYISPTKYTPEGGASPRPLYLRSAEPGSPVVCDLLYSMLEFHRKTQVLKIHYLNARISSEWAQNLDRPELAGWIVGMGEVEAIAELVSSTPSSSEPYVPKFEGGLLDVSLGGLRSLGHVSHVGTFPNGTEAMSMATVSCNIGDVDVPWLAPMEEDHPTIHMAIYRLLNGRLEQIGVSDMKHGFFALSDEDCTPCENPSDGTWLGVGCSDTYGPSNNSDRRYLAPRSEVNPYLGTWECTGSHFAGGVQDCIRRHDASGHGPTDHRLVAQDTDLDNSGATYFYEGYYIVANDAKRDNNWGSRICTMDWDGNNWNFQTPTSNNPLVPGPTIGRFGELRTAVAVAPDDGLVQLAVQTTDLGGGNYHYEYALLNMDSDRQIRSFSLPVVGVSNITNIGFHDSDPNATNDWQVTVENGTITWQTDTYAQDPNAHALIFGLMYNFRFDASSPPAAANANLGLFKPGTPTEVAVATRGPAQSSSAVQTSGQEASIRLQAPWPNPLTLSTTFHFDLPQSEVVRLEVFDASGRHVKTLADSRFSGGSHDVDWNGRNAEDERVTSGVYYARLRSGDTIAVRPLVVLN